MVIKHDEPYLICAHMGPFEGPVALCTDAENAKRVRRQLLSQDGMQCITCRRVSKDTVDAKVPVNPQGYLRPQTCRDNGIQYWAVVEWNGGGER